MIAKNFKIIANVLGFILLAVPIWIGAIELKETKKATNLTAYTLFNETYFSARESYFRHVLSPENKNVSESLSDHYLQNLINQIRIICEILADDNFDGPGISIFQQIAKNDISVFQQIAKNDISVLDKTKTDFPECHRLMDAS